MKERGRLERATALSRFVASGFGASVVVVAMSGLGCSAAPLDHAASTRADGSSEAPSARVDDSSEAAHKPEPRRAIAWERSEPDARERARRNGSGMIVYMRAEWAVASKRMERDVWSDERVEREARSFVPLMLDVTDAEADDAELYAARYEASSVPATIVIDESGKRVAVLVGEVSVDALIEALRRASE